MKSTHSLGAKLRYWFDRTMSAGTGALIGWLAILSLIIILIFGTIVALTGVTQDGGSQLSFGEAVWESRARLNFK